jgi:ribonuclease T1
MPSARWCPRERGAALAGGLHAARAGFAAGAGLRAEGRARIHRRGEGRGASREARDTLALIRKGGPFPYAKDGAIFSNREGILPKQKRGYYKEYTVKTPGERTRGARRIIWGKGGEFFYTEDHYNHFSRIH